MIGSFATQRNMIAARKSGSIIAMLSAMSLGMQRFIRPHDEEASCSGKKTAHGLNVDKNLDTAHLRFSRSVERPSKRANRRNRHRPTLAA